MIQHNLFRKINLFGNRRVQSGVCNHNIFNQATVKIKREFFHEKEDFDSFLAMTARINPNQLVYRGTDGRSEINSMRKSQKLGVQHDHYTSDPFHIFSHVIKNQSQNWFYSCSESMAYSRHYSCNHRFIPSEGSIIMLGYPKVFTRPMDVYSLIPEYYESFCKSMIEKNPEDVVTLSENKFVRQPFILPEITTILRINGESDFSPRLQQDVYAILDIKKSGKFMGYFKDAPYASAQLIKNQQFRSRKACFEMMLVNLNFSPEIAEILSQRARNKKIIKKDFSLLTFSQVLTIMKSRYYQENEYKELGDMSKPVMLHQAPKGIKDSELIEYFQNEIEQREHTPKSFGL